jgi:hypothetical protein
MPPQEVAAKARFPNPVTGRIRRSGAPLFSAPQFRPGSGCDRQRNRALAGDTVTSRWVLGKHCAQRHGYGDLGMGDEYRKAERGHGAGGFRFRKAHNARQVTDNVKYANRGRGLA